MPFANFAGAIAAMAPLSASIERRNLSRRVASGAVLGPLAMALAYIGGAPFAVALAAAGVIAFGEWLRMVAGGGRSILCLLPALILPAYWLAGPAAAAAAIIALACVVALYYRHPARHPLLSGFGAPYVGATVLGLIWLRDRPDGWSLVLLVFLIVWASDIGAFFVGRAIGGPRLAPRISPNKTWAGFGGALIASASAAAAWALVFGHTARPAAAIGLGLLLSLVGQAGDLFESAVKRRFGVKDSGGLIPGHGGALDRIDALLVAAPCFAGLHAFGLTESLLR